MLHHNNYNLQLPPASGTNMHSYITNLLPNMVFMSQALLSSELAPTPTLILYKRYGEISLKIVSSRSCIPFCAYINLELETLMNSGPRALRALREKILQLGNEYFPSDLAFPVDFLVPFLEEKSLEVAEDNFGDFGRMPARERYWICEVMLEIGVEFKNLFHIYTDMFDKQVCGVEACMTLISLCRTRSSMLA